MKKSLFLAIAIVTLSCSSDNALTDKTALKLVTGVTFRQSPEDIPLQLGNPNTFVANKFVIYPNPVNEWFQITALESITDVWVVPASAEKIHRDVNFNTVLNTGLYTEQTINFNADASLNGQSATALNMNIASLPKGYYKVFVKIDGVIYWDNLYKYDDSGNEEQITDLINFWE
jgi:hypothetical protein